MTTSAINLDYLKFKDDILKDVHDFEKKINNDIKLKNTLFESSMFDFQNKIDKLEKDSKNSNSNIIELKTQLNRLNEYFNFKQKIENMMFNHNIKLKIAGEEIENIKTKYAKMVDENLIIPGILGSKSKYKNLKEYIQNNNNEIARLKYGLEEENKNSIEFKKKLEVLPKAMVSMADSAVKRSNEYTETKQIDIEKNLDIKIEEFNKKIVEMKVENLENEKKFEENKVNILNEINKYANIKDEILMIINEKIEKLNEIEKEKDKNIEIIKQDLDEIKKTKNKYDNQVLNNTQLLNELKYKLKSMNIRRYNNYNYNKSLGKTIDNNQNNNNSLQTFSAKKKNNELNINNRNNISNFIGKPTLKQITDEEKKDNNKIRENYNSDIKNKNTKKEKENDANTKKISNEKGVKTNKELNITKNYKTEQNNNNSIQKEDLNQFLKSNLNQDSSSDERESEYNINTDQKLNRLSIQSNREIRKLLIDFKKNNNLAIPIEENKYNINKIFNNDEKINDLNAQNKKNEFELNIFKYKINNNNQKKIMPKIKSNKHINNISNEIKTKSFINYNLNDNKNAGNNGMYIDSINNSKSKIYLINQSNYDNSNENNMNIYNNQAKDNYVKEIETKITNNNNNINKTQSKNHQKIKENINIDINKKNNNSDNNSKYLNILDNLKNNNNKNNKFNVYNNSENYQYNDYLPMHSKFNLNIGIVDSFLNSNQNKSKKGLKSIQKYSSRNDFRKKENQSLEIDLKVNNIDLFAKAQKSINDKNNNTNYSFNGKKLKSKIKGKKEEEENNPLDNLYKLYYIKNHKNDDLSKKKELNNLKLLTPAFGRRAYTFYDKIDNKEI